MKLPPPLLSHLQGPSRTHSPRGQLGEQLRLPQSTVDRLLMEKGFLSAEGKVQRKALEEGLADTCEGKVIWRLSRVREVLPTAGKPKRGTSPFEEARRAEEAKKAQAVGPRWVDLNVLSTYFGVGPMKVGRWLDDLGMRAKPTMERNSSGDFDMLDVARAKQQEQATGPSGKKPTEKALEGGFARLEVVTNRKQQEIELVQWNLDRCKALLVKAGHPLDTSHKAALKGKGKNSNVQVNGMDARAQELYVKWARLYNDPKTKWQAKKLFQGQPRGILERVETLMKMPGYLTEGRYLQE